MFLCFRRFKGDEEGDVFAAGIDAQSIPVTVLSYKNSLRYSASCFALSLSTLFSVVLGRHLTDTNAIESNLNSVSIIIIFTKLRVAYATVLLKL